MDYKSKILSLFHTDSDVTFEEIAISIYDEQSKSNSTYKRYQDLLKIDPSAVNSLQGIPYLPISLFKQYEIKTGSWSSDKFFLSSGTADIKNISRHLIHDLDWYHMISDAIYQHFYPDTDSVIFGLLPNYIENEHSSLIHMVKHLSEGNNDRPFYLDNFESLYNDLKATLNLASTQSITLFGVTFALLDFAEKFQISDDRLNVIFTGGMKRRGEEMAFDIVVDKLQSGFPLSSIDAEYGMTELFSQAYSIAGSRYMPARSMRVVCQELNDVMCRAKYGKTGQLAIIDLANFDTQSFILTEDLGRCYTDGSFELLGRVSSSDLRGCSMMYAPIE